MLLRLLISLASTPSGSATGTSRAPVQPLVRVFMKVWIGSPTTSLTRPEAVKIFLRTGNSGCRGEYYLFFFLFNPFCLRRLGCCVVLVLGSLQLYCNRRIVGWIHVLQGFWLGLDLICWGGQIENEVLP